jgi:hypothetical protein
MSKRITLATFQHEYDVLGTTAELRRQGFNVLDVYSPHAIHGMDEALSMGPSRLTWVCFVCGALGVAGAFWFQHWVNAVSWAINVGGKPWNSMPAETPVAFEMMVLLAAFGSVAACLAVCRLFPGKVPPDLYAGVTDDRYVIAVDSSPAATPGADLPSLLETCGAVTVEQRVVV